MNSNTVITIGRQFGSGGHDIGKKLASLLEVPFYDKELLTEAARSSGLSEEVFKSYDETPTNSLLYSLSVGAYSMGGMGSSYVHMPINHQVFLAQFDAIKKIADRGACVIVGRCADYALNGRPHCLHVFIHADITERIRHVSERYQMSEKEAADLIAKTDKRRQNYYHFYSGKKWGALESYDLTLDSGRLGIDHAAQLIRTFAQLAI